MSHSKVAISPTTSFEQPYALKLGTKLLITVTVEHLVDAGDHYRLTGSHLSSDCYTIGVPSISAEHDQQTQIEVLIHPTQATAIGKHQLQLQLRSTDNQVLWEGTVYLQFLVADDLEIMLTPDLNVIQDGVGLYEVSITNLSDVERTLTLQPKGLPSRNGCSFKADPSQISLRPEQTQTVELMVQPLRWWRRPWFGNGRKFRFQVDLQDVKGDPLPQVLTQGTLMWQPYPRSQSYKFLGLLLLALATSSTLIWQLLFRQQAAPSIADLKPTQFIVPQTGQEDIQLSWTIENAQKLSKLVLLREGNGEAKVAKTFWFNEGIPKELQRAQSSQTANFCQYKKFESGTLECNGITTGTREAGNYQFKVQVFASNGNDPADSETTSLIAFEPKAIPQIVRFYAPSGRPQTSANGPVATAAQGPVLLNWEITNPGQLTELQVMTVDANNAEAALLRRYSLQNGKLPSSLAQYCTLNQNLTCQNIPTAARKPGQYFFKLDATYQQDQQSFTSSKTLGPMNVQGQSLRIASFLINGQPAPAKYVVKPGQKNLDLAWQVVGGINPTVAILPEPGKIQTTGSMNIKLSPKLREITLQAIDQNGKQEVQTVKLEGNVASALTQQPPSPPIALDQPQPQATGGIVDDVQFPPIAPPSELIPQPTPSSTRSPVTAVRKSPVKSSKRTSPQYTQKSLEDAQTVTRGLVVARQKGKIIPNGATWNKTQDVIMLLRRGYSHEEAAKKAGVPLWKLDILVALGKQTK
ncbi:hypothetical protein [Acaryochloris sp. IP29b_bin.148]|uniref:COG1470 family protein n=1 Tax=Acaryochloris sp. IP29b_bin.148 TaxID=2969218 RepID=UPI0026106A0A|nr:hypothetical protein [Acaryochloris sp. IP29b_bin.148]